VDLRVPPASRVPSASRWRCTSMPLCRLWTSLPRGVYLFFHGSCTLWLKNCCFFLIFFLVMHLYRIYDCFVQNGTCISAFWKFSFRFREVNSMPCAICFLVITGRGSKYFLVITGSKYWWIRLWRIGIQRRQQTMFWTRSGAVLIVMTWWWFVDPSSSRSLPSLSSLSGSAIMFPRTVHDSARGNFSAF
jgi:hypothetical protein